MNKTLQRKIQDIKTRIAREVRDLPYGHPLLDKSGKIIGMKHPARKVPRETTYSELVKLRSAYDTWIFCNARGILADELDLKPPYSKEFICTDLQWTLYNTNIRMVATPDELVDACENLKNGAIVNYGKKLVEYHTINPQLLFTSHFLNEDRLKSEEPDETLRNSKRT